MGRNAAEMRAVLPLSAILPDQLDVSFVHECGGLQRVIAAFTAQIIRGTSPKLFVTPEASAGPLPLDRPDSTRGGSG